MVRPREFEEKHVLDQAMQVFWEKGYEATSLSDLTSRMGIARPSLYAAFGDKKGLFAAALSKYIEYTIDYLRAKFEASPTVREAFRSHLLATMERAYDDSYNKGCFCVNTMVELAAHDPIFEQMTREFQSQVAALFKERIEFGQRTGELTKELHAEAIAQALSVSLIGFTVTLKSRPDRKQMEIAAEMFLTLLG